MARARNLKPSFFTNDELAEVEPLGRLLFQGLWCLADRAGRLEDRPKKIKAELLPYDDCNVDELLQALESHGFILRYQVCGTRFIQVINFAKHQNPHMKEAESTIPAPCKHSADPVQGMEFPERAGLIPDSLNPLTDSTTSNSNELLVPSDAEDGKPACPHKQIVALYHEVLPMCPQVRDWTPARATQLRARWNEDKARQNLDYWKRFFAYVAECDFLVGKGSGKPFFADLEWLTKAANFTKVREGKYANREAA